MIGIRSTLPACNCIYRFYDCCIYRRINAELPSSVYDVPIDEVNPGSTSPFEVLQHGCPRVTVNIQDFIEPQIMRFSRNPIDRSPPMPVTLRPDAVISSADVAFRVARETEAPTARRRAPMIPPNAAAPTISVFMNPPHDLSIVIPSMYVADFAFDDTP